MDCSHRCIKCLMLAFIILFWLLGCSLLVVGIWFRTDSDLSQYTDSSDLFNDLYTGANILIAVGVICMMAGFFGCLSVIRENACMLLTFTVFLFVIFITLLGAGIWAVAGRGDLQAYATVSLNNAVKDYYDTSKPYAKNFMDKLQHNMDCCGSSGASADYRSYGKPVPDSCSFYGASTPCDRKLFEYFADNLGTIAGVAIGIGVVMLLGMGISILLYRAIRQDFEIV